jgi:hypothetical protein
VQLAAATTALVMVAGAWYISRGPREVTVDGAVESFRRDATIAEATPAPASAKPAPAARAEQAPKPKAPASAKQPPAAAAAAPQAQPSTFVPPREGVYVYATDGYEETDALSGARHDYPASTTITNRKAGCGWTSRWQPLQERWEESEFCETPQGTRLKRYTMYHEFYRRGIREDFACDGFVQKPGARPGDTWTMTCKSPQSTAKGTNTVVGIETMNVGGKPIKAVHMRYDLTVSGANSGRMIQDRWLSEQPRAMLRMTQDADLDVDSPFGKTGYREKFRIDLRSLEPRT